MKTNEGTIKVIVNDTVPLGTTFLVSKDGGRWVASKNGYDVNFIENIEKVQGSVSFAQGGDNVFIYTGQASEANFIFGFSASEWLTDSSESVDTNDSFLPHSLQNASIAFTDFTTNRQINASQLPEAATADIFLDSITDEANWLGQVNRYELTAARYVICGCHSDIYHQQIIDPHTSSAQ